MHFQANAPRVASFTLMLELLMGLALVLGGWQARRGRYRLHAWCQSLVVLANLGVIAIAMVPSLHQQVLPKLPARLGRMFYLLAAAHATAGALAEIFALYLMLAAGTHWLPERYRLVRFREAMRAALLLWWLALSLGVATYVRWYVRF